MTGMKTVIIGDTQYTITRFLKEGMKAAHKEIPFYCNPYREGSQRYYDWDDGHMIGCMNEEDLKMYCEDEEKLRDVKEELRKILTSS